MTPGGSVLRGLGFLKTKPEVHAMEDEQYPDFLWGLLEPGAEKKGKEGGKGGDAGMYAFLFSLSVFGCLVGAWVMMLPSIPRRFCLVERGG